MATETTRLTKTQVASLFASPLRASPRHLLLLAPLRPPRRTGPPTRCSPSLRSAPSCSLAAAAPPLRRQPPLLADARSACLAPRGAAWLKNAYRPGALATTRRHARAAVLASSLSLPHRRLLSGCASASPTLSPRPPATCLLSPAQPPAHLCAAELHAACRPPQLPPPPLLIRRPRRPRFAHCRSANLTPRATMRRHRCDERSLAASQLAGALWTEHWKQK